MIAQVEPGVAERQAEDSALEIEKVALPRMIKNVNSAGSQIHC